MTLESIKSSAASVVTVTAMLGEVTMKRLNVLSPQIVIEHHVDAALCGTIHIALTQL